MAFISAALRFAVQAAAGTVRGFARSACRAARAEIAARPRLAARGRG